LSTPDITVSTHHTVWCVQIHVVPLLLEVIYLIGLLQGRNFLYSLELPRVIVLKILFFVCYVLKINIVGICEHHLSLLFLGLVFLNSLFLYFKLHLSLPFHLFLFLLLLFFLPSSLLQFLLSFILHGRKLILLLVKVLLPLDFLFTGPFDLLIFLASLLLVDLDLSSEAFFAISF
jgi:hypothetical protein